MNVDRTLSTGAQEQGGQDELSALPMQANLVNPSPGADAVSIVGLVKRSGKITGYQLSNGERVTKQQGVELAKSNRIKGVAVAVNQGTEYLRALPDQNEQNNLGNLPSINE